MRPIPLDVDGMAHIYAAVKPLSPDRCDDFLRALAGELARQTVIGPGLVFRTIAVVWPKFFDPPNVSGDDDMPGGRVFHVKVGTNFWDQLNNHS
jgi:hypothetical protein